MDGRWDWRDNRTVTEARKNIEDLLGNARKLELGRPARQLAVVDAALIFAYRVADEIGKVDVRPILRVFNSVYILGSKNEHLAYPIIAQVNAVHHAGFAFNGKSIMAHVVPNNEKEALEDILPHPAIAYNTGNKDLTYAILVPIPEVRRP